jgi:hypothetical protein
MHVFYYRSLNILLQFFVVGTMFTLGSKDSLDMFALYVYNLLVQVSLLDSNWCYIAMKDLHFHFFCFCLFLIISIFSWIVHSIIDSIYNSWEICALVKQDISYTRLMCATKVYTCNELQRCTTKMQSTIKDATMKTLRIAWCYRSALKKILHVLCYTRCDVKKCNVLQRCKRLPQNACGNDDAIVAMAKHMGKQKKLLNYPMFISTKHHDNL